jgi:tripartite-type tricarboxylate transporter receptor subunit TctC
MTGSNPNFHPSAFLRRLSSACGLALLLGATLSPVHAQQGYPDRPIRVIIPTAAAGASDMIGRLIAQRVSESMKVPVVIDNRPGASNTVGTAIAAKAKPDGYTLLLTFREHVFAPFLYKLPYDTVKDFTPVIHLGEVPLLLTANPHLGVKTVPELIAMAKASPGKLNYASPGSGSTVHLTGEQFKTAAGIDVTHVPYKGTAPAYIDLLAGQVQYTFATAASGTAYVKDGRLVALGVASKKRLATLPQVPTIAEQGLPGFESGIWYAVLAPAGTPAPIVDRLYTEFRKAVLSPDVSAKLKEQGFEIEIGTPKQLGAKIDAEIERSGKLIRDAKIKVE